MGRISAPSVLVPNLFLVQSLVPQAVGTGIIPAWSLTAELTFYALLPLVGYLAWFLARRMSKAVALVVGPLVFIAIAAVTNRALGHDSRGLGVHGIFTFDWGNTWSAVWSRSFLANADLFAFGMLAALTIGLLRHKERVPMLSRMVKTTALVVIVVVWAYERHVDGWVSVSVCGICAAALIVLTVLPSHSGGTQNGLARVLEWGPIRYVGLISYSLYLWHLPVILFLKEHGLLLPQNGTEGLIVNLIIVLTIVVALASLTYAFVEKPAMALRGRLPSRTIEITTSTGSSDLR